LTWVSWLTEASRLTLANLSSGVRLLELTSGLGLKPLSLLERAKARFSLVSQLEKVCREWQVLESRR
jgi:hypothetical protein